MRANEINYNFLSSKFIMYGFSSEYFLSEIKQFTFGTSNMIFNKNLDVSYIFSQLFHILEYFF